MTTGVTKHMKIINRYFFIFILLPLVTISCSTYVKQPEVKFAGALRNIMHKGDISSEIELSLLRDKKNLYALGAFENLKGEVQIFNSEARSTYVNEKGELNFDLTYDKKAALLVYSEVPQWVDYKIPVEVTTREQFEIFLEEKAKQHGLNTEVPFPFLIEGTLQYNSWHVINWNPKDKIHTHQKHIQSGINRKSKNMHATVIGFYSKKHTGIFTHHTTNMHIHFISSDKNLAGHSDNIVLGKKMILKLPKL